MGTPLFDQAASRTDQAAWNRWQNTPDNEAMLLTKRELADILEAILSLSKAIDATSASVPMQQLVKSILNVSDRKVTIDGGTY